MPIDLTFARARAAERLLVDRATIDRNPGGWSNEMFDDVSGDYIVADPDQDVADDATTVALGVPCSVRESSLQERADAVGSVTGGTPERTVQKIWIVSFDFEVADALALEFGDRIRLTLSQDPNLLGVPMYLRRFVTGTHRVFRRVECTRRFDAEHRD